MEKVTMAQNLRSMQKSILEVNTEVYIGLNDALKGDRIDFDRLSELEDDLGFLYQRIRELNANT